MQVVKLASCCYSPVCIHLRLCRIRCKLGLFLTRYLCPDACERAATIRLSSAVSTAWSHVNAHLHRDKTSRTVARIMHEDTPGSRRAGERKVRGLRIMSSDRTGRIEVWNPINLLQGDRTTENSTTGKNERRKQPPKSENADKPLFLLIVV